MTIDFSEDGKLKLMIIDYLEDILDKCIKYGMTSTALWPAYETLFKVDEKTTKLNNKDGNFFHKITARLLYASKRARPDIHFAISFLCTHVKTPDKHAMVKLKRVIEYFRKTILSHWYWDGMNLGILYGAFTHPLLLILT